MSYDDKESDLISLLISLVLAAIALAVVAVCYRSDYRKCMEERNDPMFCEIYASRDN